MFKTARAATLTMLLTGCAGPETDPLEKFIVDFGNMPLGISVTEFKKRYPAAVPENLPSIGQNYDKTIHRQKLSVGPFTETIYSFRADKLIMAMTSSGLERLADSGWEDGESVVRWGKPAYQAMIKAWGAPTRAGIDDDYEYIAEKTATIEWNRGGAILQAIVTTPASLMEASESDRNPRGSILLLIRHPEDVPVDPFKSATTPFDEKSMEGDSEEFRRRNEVLPQPETKRLIPPDLSGVHLGMTTDELRSLRPKVRADDFMNEREVFFEYLEGPRFQDVEYRARRDRVVVVSLSVAGEKTIDPVVIRTLARECESRWGAPSSLLQWDDPGPDGKLIMNRVYLWSHSDALTGLNLGNEPPKWAKVVIFEKRLPDQYAVPRSKKIQETRVVGDELKKEWSLLIQ